jgi:membrane-associated phospholipid phosphatase
VVIAAPKGADAGPGTGRSYYATPLDLGLRPWSLDFTHDDSGAPAYPFEEIINPYQQEPFLEWMPKNWDPALWYWALPFDPRLGEWLKVVDPSRAYITAGREFAAFPDFWQFDRNPRPDRPYSPGRPGLLDIDWLEHLDLAWQPDRDLSDSATCDQVKRDAWNSIRAEIEQLQQLMHDDRERYLAEIEAQADGLPGYVIAFMGISHATHPWTVELINCGLSIGNLVYSYYKQHFKRVRPSVLCPGLAPPFGPPAHPAFPSGHSFLGHLMALLLLEIPAIWQRFGMFDPVPRSAKSHGSVGKPVDPYPSVTISQEQSGTKPVVITLSAPGLSAHELKEKDAITFRKSQDPISAEKTYLVRKEALSACTFTITEKIGGAIVESEKLAKPLHNALNKNPLMGRGEIRSPLLWLAQRMAKNRERLGVHYPSDSSASRHLAAAVWRKVLHTNHPDAPVDAMLRVIIMNATAEWFTPWP